jgi:predicted Zn-dependent peptidase
VKKYFGVIPRQPSPPQPDASEEEHYGERRETITDPLARLPMVLISYHIPRGDTPDNYAVKVLGDILNTGQSSRFYQHLVKEQQLATSVEVQVDARRGASLFYIMAMPRPGVKPEDLEQAIYKEIGAVAKDGVTAAEVDKARTQFRRSMIQTRESDLRTAIQMGQYTVFFNDPGLINTIVDKYDSVTAEQIKSAAQKYLVPTERAVVTTLPEQRAGTVAGGN